MNAEMGVNLNEDDAYLENIDLNCTSKEVED